MLDKVRLGNTWDNLLIDFLNGKDNLGMYRINQDKHIRDLIQNSDLVGLENYSCKRKVEGIFPPIKKQHLVVGNRYLPID